MENRRFETWSILGGFLADPGAIPPRPREKGRGYSKGLIGKDNILHAPNYLNAIESQCDKSCTTNGTEGCGGLRIGVQQLELYNTTNEVLHVTAGGEPCNRQETGYRLTGQNCGNLA